MKLATLAAALAVIVLPTAAAAQVTYTANWSPASIGLGGSTTFTLTIDNDTATPVTAATSTVTFPGSWTFLGASGCTGTLTTSPTTVALNLGVAANTLCTLNFNVTPASAGTYPLNTTDLSYVGGDGASPKPVTAGANPMLSVSGPIPTMSEWATILFGGLLAIGAALYIQRRRFA